MPRRGDVTSSNPLIAVVDDDAAVRNSLKFSLEIEGFDVRAYGSASELLRAKELTAYQCLIVNQDSPDMSGLELVATLRRQGVKTPAVLISGHVTPMTVRHAAGAGVPVVERPFLEDRLVELIRAATGTKRT